MIKLGAISACIPLITLLTSCNLYGGLSSPSNDEQHVSAARACLDHGDYSCALEHYRAISDAYADVRINETSLTQLAQAQVFSIADMIASIGTSLGSGNTLISMTELVASRNVMNAANRAMIQRTYANNDLISNQNPKLRAFSKFISAVAMFNTLMASAVGPDGKLTASDLAVGGTACIGDASLVQCAAPGGTNLIDTNGSEPANMGASGWENSPSVDMVWTALSDASTEINTFAGNASGILSVIVDIINTGAATPAAKRQQLIQILGIQ